MATQRRTNIPEKTVLSHAEIKAEPKSNIAPAVPSFVHPKAIQLSMNVADHNILTIEASSSSSSPSLSP
jgi:glutamate/tyrosine decarboxylase-like PLP-dependent enzyme